MTGNTTRTDGGTGDADDTGVSGDSGATDGTGDGVDSGATGDSADIGEKMDRIRDIVAQLEDGEVSLERATELRDEGKALLADVEAHLDLGEGSVVERE